MTAPADLTDAADAGRITVRSFTQAREESRRRAWENTPEPLRRIAADQARRLGVDPMLSHDVPAGNYRSLSPAERVAMAAAAMYLADVFAALSDVGLPST